MSDSRSHPDIGIETRAECNTPCKVCETLLSSAETVRAYNNYRKASEINTDVETWDMFNTTWFIGAPELHNRCHNHEAFLSPYLSLPEYKMLTDIGITFARGSLRLDAFFPGKGDNTPSRSRSCDAHHGSKCADRLATLSHPLSYLIDTQQMCLVPAQPDMVYVALSYVWGQVRMLKTTRENLERLQQPKALQTLEGQLPRTIRDSIALVPLLEERYLWVDSLCIPQDDERVVQLNIGQMAAIFESASFTIVACDGNDADFGLRGLRHSSHPRSLPGLLSLAPGIALTTRSQDILHGTPWSQRGWTLQEQIFSRRSIVFYENTVQWMCRSIRYYEDVDSPLDLHLALPAQAFHNSVGDFEQLNPLDFSLDVPDLSTLCCLISNYLQRHFTYQEDVIPAFSSTLNAMHRAFPRGFIQGLPVSFFDASLIWRSEAMARRQSSKEGVKCPPSWTWAGWKGKIWHIAWTSATYIKNAPREVPNPFWLAYQVIPMLVWHIKDFRDSEEKRIPFQNEWHEYKSKFMGKSHDLPRGWVYRKGKEEEELKPFTIHEDPECQITSEQLHTPYYYEHESCSGRRFWHPVPVGTSWDKGGYGEVVQSQYLCARTQKAQLWASKPHREDQVWSRRLVVVRLFGYDLLVQTVLRDQAGAIVGELCPDSEVELRRIKGAYPSAVPVDLVAISRGLHLLEPQPVKKETWSFYNVLWVEWEDGIAYRKGIGRVKRSVWERLEKEDISLVMG